MVNHFATDVESDTLVKIFSGVDQMTSPDIIQRSVAPMMRVDTSKAAILIMPIIFTASSLLSYHDGYLGLENFVVGLVKCSAIVGLVVPTVLTLLSKTSESRRSSWMIQLGGTCPLGKDVAEKIVSRAAELLSTSPDVFERPTLTRYSKGQEFKLHNDASADTSLDGWDQLGGQRLITCIVYLNNVASGGGTYFDKLNIRIKPTKGTALIFFPADTDGVIDHRTTHCGEKAQDDKYIVQLWRRQRRVPAPLGYIASKVMAEMEDSDPEKH